MCKIFFAELEHRLQLLKIFHINVCVESMDVLSEFGCRRLKLEKS